MNKRKIKKFTKINVSRLIAGIALALVSGLAGFLIAKQGGVIDVGKTENADKLYKVDYVIDGDTIKLKDGTRVRLLGIDSPEKGECFYEESRLGVKDLIEGKQVFLEREITGEDNYGRLLRYVFLPADDEIATHASTASGNDRLFVNNYIVRQGWGRDFSDSPDNRYRDLLVTAREEALRENRGLWKQCDYKNELSEINEGDDQAPGPDYYVKGNISSKGYGKTYLIPGCDNYNLVKIDLSKGEMFFKSEEEAVRAGFRKATNCP